MKLSAREKRQRPDLDKKQAAANEQTQQTRSDAQSAGQKAQVGAYSQNIYIRCNTMLYHTLQNMVNSAHTAGDFTYVSVADLIRASLEAYAKGMQLTELDQTGEKMATTIRVNKGLRDFYGTLPNRLRAKIVERAIRTFIKG